MPAVQRTSKLPIWLWLYVPVLVLISIIAIIHYFSSVGGILKVTNSSRYYFNLADFLLNNENGIIELGTVLVLLPGIIYGLLCLKLSRYLPNKLIFSWLLLIIIACIYFAGEEISWGQHLFSWKTPESIKILNDQGETNFHNMSSWLDQKPRLILELGVFLGGICAPLFIKFRKISFDSENWQDWLWPPIYILPTATFTILARLPDRLNIVEPTMFFYGLRLSEVQEFYFAYFLMLYLLISYKRLKDEEKIKSHLV